jgi:hypothetical protein
VPPVGAPGPATDEVVGTGTAAVSPPRGNGEIVGSTGTVCDGTCSDATAATPGPQRDRGPLCEPSARRRPSHQPKPAQRCIPPRRATPGAEARLSDKAPGRGPSSIPGPPFQPRGRSPRRQPGGPCGRGGAWLDWRPGDIGRRTKPHIRSRASPQVQSLTADRAATSGPAAVNETGRLGSFCRRRRAADRSAGVPAGWPGGSVGFVLSRGRTTSRRGGPAGAAGRRTPALASFGARSWSVCELQSRSAP